MHTNQIKQQLHDYIETADAKKLKAIYTLVQDDIGYNGHLTPEQLQELDRRMYEHENGIGRTYTWEEVNDILDKAVK